MDSRFDPFDDNNDEASVDEDIFTDGDASEAGSEYGFEISGDKAPASPTRHYKIGLTRKKLSCPSNKLLEKHHFQVIKRYFSKGTLLLFSVTPLGDKCFIRSPLEKKTQYDIELKTNNRGSTLPSSLKNGALSNIPISSCGVVFMDNDCMEIHQKLSSKDSDREKYSVVKTLVENQGQCWTSYPIYDISHIKNIGSVNAGESTVVRDTNGFNRKLLKSNFGTHHKLMSEMYDASEDLSKTVLTLNELSENAIKELCEECGLLQGELKEKYESICSNDNLVSTENEEIIEDETKAKVSFYQSVNDSASVVSKLENLNSAILLSRDITAEISSITQQLGKISNLMKEM